MGMGMLGVMDEKLERETGIGGSVGSHWWSG